MHVKNIAKPIVFNKRSRDRWKHWFQYGFIYNFYMHLLFCAMVVVVFVREFSSLARATLFQFLYEILVRFFLFTFRARCKYFVDSTIHLITLFHSRFCWCVFSSSMHKLHTIHSVSTSSTSCSSLIHSFTRLPFAICTKHSNSIAISWVLMNFCTMYPMRNVFIEFWFFFCFVVFFVVDVWFWIGFDSNVACLLSCGI